MPPTTGSMQPSKTGATPLWILALLLLIAPLPFAPAHAAAGDPTPFTCSGDMFQVINGQLYQLDVASSTYQPIGTAANFEYSMGYRRSDDLLYGIVTGTASGTDGDGVTVNVGDLISIDATGKTRKVAATGETTNNHNSADIHQGRGTLWARNGDKTTLSEFDLATGATLQTITVTGSNT
ncbi:MAG: hypothetical protein R3E89_16755, partial [Thiolinea sp.]